LKEDDDDDDDSGDGDFIGISKNPFKFLYDSSCNIPTNSNK
jgi:hypothetical protein